MRLSSTARAAMLATLLLVGASGCARQGQRAASTGPDAALTTQVTREELRQLAADAYAAGDWQRAEQRYGEVTRRNPADVEAWFRLGNIHARTGREALAVMAYREVVKRDPKHARAWHNLGVVQVRMAIATFGEMGEAADPGDPLTARGAEMASGLKSLLAPEPGAASEPPLDPQQP
jgi:cytochrome c-type biogenesis protein CcmH/NrfG